MRPSRQNSDDVDRSAGNHPPWRAVVVWTVVGVVAFVWASAVLGIALRLADRDSSASQAVIVFGTIPIVALIVLTWRFVARMPGADGYAAPSSGPSSASGSSERSAPAPREAVDITEREREVLRLLATGRTQTEIAKDLFVAPGTVKAHVNSIYGKLGARNRTEALGTARTLGLID